MRQGCSFSHFLVNALVPPTARFARLRRPLRGARACAATLPLCHFLAFAAPPVSQSARSGQVQRCSSTLTAAGDWRRCAVRSCALRAQRCSASSLERGPGPPAAGAPFFCVRSLTTHQENDMAVRATRQGYRGNHGRMIGRSFSKLLSLERRGQQGSKA